MNSAGKRTEKTTRTILTRNNREFTQGTCGGFLERIPVRTCEGLPQ